MTARVHLPDVRDVVLSQIGVEAFADTHQAVLVTARHPEQLERFGGAGRIGISTAGGLVLGAEENAPIQANERVSPGKE
jgi:hypothetical protein